jgi:hypothetical protein
MVCELSPSPNLSQVLADIAIFDDGGLNVVYVDKHPYMHGTTTDTDMNDPLHPNARSHSELRTAFETAIP